MCLDNWQKEKTWVWRGHSFLSLFIYFFQNWPPSRLSSLVGVGQGFSLLSWLRLVVKRRKIVDTLERRPTFAPALEWGDQFPFRIPHIGPLPWFLPRFRNFRAGGNPLNIYFFAYICVYGLLVFLYVYICLCIYTCVYISPYICICVLLSDYLGHQF